MSQLQMELSVKASVSGHGSITTRKQSALAVLAYHPSDSSIKPYLHWLNAEVPGLQESYHPPGQHARCSVYTPTDPNNQNMYIVFRGTLISSWQDIKSDVALFFNKIPKLYQTEFKPFLEVIFKKFPNRTVTHIGHSLGGAMAQFAAGEYGGKAVCFDSPGCMSILASAGINAPKQVEIYYCYPNLVNQFGQHVTQPKNLNLPSPLVKKIKNLELQIKIASGLLRLPLFLLRRKRIPGIGRFVTKAAVHTFILQRKYKLLTLAHSVNNFAYQLGATWIPLKGVITKSIMGITNSNSISELTKFDGSFLPIEPSSMHSLVPTMHHNKTTMVLWKQDPSNHELGLSEVIFNRRFYPGPSSEWIKIAGVQVPPKQDGSFKYSDKDKPEYLNAIHTSAVVHRIFNLYMEMFKKINLRWQGWNSSSGQISIIPTLKNCANAYYGKINGKCVLMFGEVALDKKVSGSSQIFRVCRSYDIVAHETGHAILDSIKPQYMREFSEEERRSGLAIQTAAFHEAFADLTVVFALLHEFDICNYVIKNSQGNLSRDNVVGVIGEELGSELLNSEFGIRNLNNSYTLKTIPSLECHTLSMVFSGAIYDILREFYRIQSQTTSNLTQALYKSTKRVFALFLQSVAKAPNHFVAFGIVAKNMAELETNELRRNIILQAFHKRLIINVHTKNFTSDATPEGGWNINNWSFSDSCYTVQPNLQDKENINSEIKALLDQYKPSSAKLQNKLDLPQQKIVGNRNVSHFVGDKKLGFGFVNNMENELTPGELSELLEDETSDNQESDPNEMTEFFRKNVEAYRKLKPDEQKLQNELIDAGRLALIDKVKELQKKGARLDVSNQYGETPLRAAIFGLNLDLVKYIHEALDERSPAFWQDVKLALNVQGFNTLVQPIPVYNKQPILNHLAGGYFQHLSHLRYCLGIFVDTCLEYYYNLELKRDLKGDCFSLDNRIGNGYVHIRSNVNPNVAPKINSFLMGIESKKQELFKYIYEKCKSLKVEKVEESKQPGQTAQSELKLGFFVKKGGSPELLLNACRLGNYKATKKHLGAIQQLKKPELLQALTQAVWGLNLKVLKLLEVNCAPEMISEFWRNLVDKSDLYFQVPEKQGGSWGQIHAWYQKTTETPAVTILNKLTQYDVSAKQAQLSTARNTTYTVAEVKCILCIEMCKLACSEMKTYAMEQMSECKPSEVKLVNK